MKHLIYHGSCKILFGLFQGLLDFEVLGRENIPARGGAVLAANHASFLDIPVVGVPLRRHVSFVGRSTLAESRFLDWVLSAYDAIRIDRGASDMVAIREIVERLRQGRLVGLFPEGTRTRDGKLGTFQKGGALVARRAGVPLIPTAISGTFACLPRGRMWPRKTKIQVQYGKPLDASTGALEGVVEELRRRIARMLDVGPSGPAAR